MMGNHHTGGADDERGQGEKRKKRHGRSIPPLLDYSYITPPTSRVLSWVAKNNACSPVQVLGNEIMNNTHMISTIPHDGPFPIVTSLVAVFCFSSSILSRGEGQTPFRSTLSFFWSQPGPPSHFPISN